MATANRADVAKDDGGSFIPASQRPDGTWRKPRRVKDGYVPQEEVPLYESKGKQFAKKPMYPVGMSASVAESMKAERAQRSANNPIPGLTITPKDEASKKKKKKKASSTSANEVKVITESLSKTKLDWPGKEAGSKKKPVEAPDLTGAGTDPAKKLKNLKKKLRDIEALELKVKSGEVKPDKDQVEKMNRKEALVEQIAELEAEEKS